MKSFVGSVTAAGAPCDARTAPKPGAMSCAVTMRAS